MTRGASDVIRGLTSPPAVPGRRRLRPLSVAGVALLLVGLGCLGWVGYQIFGTDLASEHAYRQETGQLRSQWQQAAGPSADSSTGSGAGSSGGSSSGSAPSASRATIQEAVPGDAIALLRVPRFGAGYQVPILQGTDLSVLAKGVGHYQDTAMPGQIGNFAVAGHRITHGQPFAELDELGRGDTVVVETRTAVYTYRLDTAPRDLTVEQNAGWVLDAVPGKPTAVPTTAMITLTTCQDLFHSPDRSVGFGTLVATENK